MKSQSKRTLYLLLGHLNVAFGVFGIILPVLPATPFMILAAFFYSRSSPQLHQKILNLPHIGIHVRNWEEHGMISEKAKWASVFCLLIMIGSSIYFLKNLWLRILLSLIALSVSYFIFSRPSGPNQNSRQ